MTEPQIPPIFGGPRLFGTLLPEDPTFEGLFRWLERNAPAPGTVYVIGAAPEAARDRGVGLGTIAIVAATLAGLAWLVRSRT